MTEQVTSFLNWLTSDGRVLVFADWDGLQERLWLGSDLVTTEDLRRWAANFLLDIGATDEVPASVSALVYGVSFGVPNLPGRRWPPH